MAIDTSGMLARLSPIAPINLGGIGGGGSMERERLKLMKQQFEFQKQQHRESQELGRLRIQSQLAQQQLEREEAARQAAAKQLELKRAGTMEFSKLAGSGDIEGARALVPYLASVGQGVELLGEEGGMPSFRMFDLDDQGNEVQAPEQGIGYPTDETGSLDVPAGIPSTEEAFGRALGASQHFAETGQPLRGPDEPDYTGGVPRNVIDTGAMAMATRARLQPLLGGLIQAYPDASGADPDAYRRSAAATAQAVADSGMPALKALDQFKALRTGADSIIGSQIEANAQAGRFDQTQQAAKERQGNTQHERGWKAAKEAAAVYNIEDMRTARKQTEEALRIITNEDDADDYMVGALISRRLGERGATTEQDIARVLGTAAMSFLDRIKNRLYKEAFGGLTWDQKNALAGVLKSTKEKDDAQFMEYLRELDDQASAPDADKDRAAGIREYVNVVVPRDIRDAYKAKKQSETDATSGASPIPETSRIARVHNNPGNLKYAEQDGATQGEAASDGGHWANFETYEDGLKALEGQIEKDMKRGLTVEQFVTKYAPPGSNDTAKYIADAVKALGAAATQKLSELDIGKVVAFVAKKESSTDVSKKLVAPSKADADALDILNRSGY